MGKKNDKSKGRINETVAAGEELLINNCNEDFKKY